MNRSSHHLSKLVLLSSLMLTSLGACEEGYYDGTGAFKAVPPRTGESENADMGNFFADNLKEGDQAIGPYYVLLRDCAFPACHASQERFFRVFGPGRARIPGTKFDNDVFFFEGKLARISAQEFINPDNPSQSMLLRKPLSVSAGGAGHGGVDYFGRDVYSSTSDDGYQVLARWVEDGAKNYEKEPELEEAPE